jgi:hypothetical protein
MPSSMRSRPTADGSGKVAAVLLALATLLAEDAATEGKKVIAGMLLVGLTFVAVILLGETSKSLRHRRRLRRARRRAY